MLEIIFSIIIFPIVQLIDIVYLFLWRVFGNHGISILCLSFVISILTLPLYLIAEKWQQSERTIQNTMKYRIQRIKAVFSGDEQYLILSAYYRHNHYHPVYALRSTFGLLIQIPFFISAYYFISNLKVLQNISFFFIKDLLNPDTLLVINNFSLNLLPILMTIINIISGVIYSKGLSIRDKVQIFIVPAIFLLLLYNSPSALVLYWTANNLFSLIKNIIIKNRNPLRTVYYIIFGLVIIFDIYVLFFHSGYYVKRIFAVIFISSVLLIPLIIKYSNIFISKYFNSINNNDILNKQLFFISVICNFILIGIIIPSSLIASSTQEFSFIGSNSSPFPFIFTTINQAIGIFIFWPICIYYLFSSKIKILITYFSCLLLLIFCINNFIFSGNYGTITTTLILSNPGTFFTNIHFVIINILTLLIIILIFSLFIFSHYRKILFSFLIILTCTFSGMTIFNIIKIKTEYQKLLNMYSHETASIHDEFEPVFNLSKNGKNVFIIMLDRALSAYIPYIFDEKQELINSFSGFKRYPNSISYGSFTIFGVPPLFGGYEYTPAEIQKQNNRTLIDKYNESLLVLPKLFLDNNYKVTITDPPWANFSWKPDLEIYKPLFQEGKDLYVENLSGKYSSHWLENHPEAQIVSVPDILSKNLIRFSIFKISPAIIRTFIFDRGKWLSTEALADDIDIDQKLTISTINDYSVLDYLPQLTGFLDSGNTFTIFANLLTHEPAFFQAPDYVPMLKITDIGSGPYSQVSEYHANMAAFLLLGKWFNFLKENNVYDNTRFIIVSDHGWYIGENFPYFLELPNGSNLQSYNMLLLLKDFNSSDVFSIDNTFMTGADVPSIALNGLVEKPKNPFTQNEIKISKSEPIIITTSGKLHPTSHSKYIFKIENNEWLSVTNNIFDIKNWKNENLH